MVLLEVLAQSGEEGGQETAHGDWRGGRLSTVCGSVPSVPVRCLSEHTEQTIPTDCR